MLWFTGNLIWVLAYITMHVFFLILAVGQRNSIKFGIPMIWRDPDEHDNATCYVCQNKGILKLNRHRRNTFVYKAVPSAVLPVPHSDELPVPVLHVQSSSQHFDATTCSRTQFCRSADS